MEEKKSTYRGVTPAQVRATLKYKKKAYEVMCISVRKGTREKYKAAAARAGMSFAQFVLQSMDEKIARDNLE